MKIEQGSVHLRKKLITIILKTIFLSLCLVVFIDMNQLPHCAMTHKMMMMMT